MGQPVPPALAYTLCWDSRRLRVLDIGNCGTILNDGSLQIPLPKVRTRRREGHRLQTRAGSPLPPQGMHELRVPIPHDRDAVLDHQRD
jgi:hypothetical protein